MNPLYPAFITGAVAITIAVINHFVTFVVYRHKNKKSKLENKLKALYSPLYLQVRALANNDPRLNMEAITLDARMDGFSEEDINKILNENAIYASSELIEKWMDFFFYRSSNTSAHNFAVTVVKEYNELRKELKLEYDEIELASGYPKDTTMYLAYQATK
nr:hypothetical protein [Neobacillus sp. Marseille-Q6967]